MTSTAMVAPQQPQAAMPPYSHSNHNHTTTTTTTSTTTSTSTSTSTSTTRRYDHHSRHTAPIPPHDRLQDGHLRRGRGYGVAARAAGAGKQHRPGYGCPRVAGRCAGDRHVCHHIGRFDGSTPCAGLADRSPIARAAFAGAAAGSIKAPPDTGPRLREEPAEPAPSELLAEIQQLRIALADAQHSSKAAWEARAEDWKAFEAQRAATKLALAETAGIARQAQDANFITVEAPERKHAAIEHHNQPQAVALEHKESPPGTGGPNTTVTAEQLNLAIRGILSPAPVIVQGVLSPRGAGGLLDRPTACKTGNASSTSSKSPTTQLRGKRRSRNWSRHKKGPWNVGDAAAASTGAPGCRSPRLQKLDERQTVATA